MSWYFVAVASDFTDAAVEIAAARVAAVVSDVEIAGDGVTGR